MSRRGRGLEGDLQEPVGFAAMASDAAALIKKVAELYPTEPSRLDHVIWRHVSGRDVFKDEEVAVRAAD